VTNPNCSTIALTMTLKPLYDKFDIERIYVSTMQAVSGAGYDGVPSMAIVDNLVPFIGGEEEKMETETLELLGDLGLFFRADFSRARVGDFDSDLVYEFFQGFVNQAKVTFAY